MLQLSRDAERWGRFYKQAAEFGDRACADIGKPLWYLDGDEMMRMLPMGKAFSELAQLPRGAGAGVMLSHIRCAVALAIVAALIAIGQADAGQALRQTPSGPTCCCSTWRCLGSRARRSSTRSAAASSSR